MGRGGRPGRRGRWALVFVAALCACAGSGPPGDAAQPPGPDPGATPQPTGGDGAPTAQPPAPPPDTGTGGADPGTGAADAFQPPVNKDHWSFFGVSQGLSQDVWDVSADEGGAVYVAGGDALYAKERDDLRFLRFDAASGGLTENCYQVPPETDPGFEDAINGTSHPDPPGPPILCPVISVAGAGPGRAAVGFKGLGTDEEHDADWAQDGGGMDLVLFDGTHLSRLRHVFIASPPHTVCVDGTRESFADSCPNPWEYFWVVGRRKLRQVHRIVVNHDAGSPLYGDIFMGGTHASISALLHDASARGYPDHTLGQPAKWADARGTWEHDHPAFTDEATGQFLTPTTHAIAIHPGSGIPWVSNGLRTAWLAGYGADLHSNRWWLEPATSANPLWIDIWPDPGPASSPIDPLGPSYDDVQSLSFCDDGTLWVGSYSHGLAVSSGDGFSYLDLPDPGLHGDSVSAVACDPSDQSVWIGLGWGGVMRLRGGRFEALDPQGLPAFVRQPVQSIQIDRWSTPRIVYFAFIPSRDASGRTIRGGGVASYDGP
jgi:hypothetical protein